MVFTNLFAASDKPKEIMLTERYQHKLWEASVPYSPALAVFSFLLIAEGNALIHRKPQLIFEHITVLVHHTSCTSYRITFIATSWGGLIFTHELTIVGRGMESETSFLRTTQWISFAAPFLVIQKYWAITSRASNTLLFSS